jgi:Transcriptional Coactivator p15 (PC4)
MTSRPTLAEPIRWRFFKNRRHEQIVTSLETYEGSNLVNIRTWFTDKAGIDRPTPKGFTLSVRRLPDLVKSVNAAHAKALELGLLDDGGDE